MERQHDGEREHRRFGYDRDRDEQDFTQRSFADPRHRAYRREAWEDMEYGRSQRGAGEQGVGRFDDRFPGDPSGRSMQREREHRFGGSHHEGDDRRPWGERGDVYGTEQEDSPPLARRFEAPSGGHRSQQGWREQHGWGRDVARDLDAEYDPYGGRFAGRGPKSYQRGDERIREDVCDRLTADHHVDASDITVTVQSGEVTLEGTVDARRMKRRAEDCAENVSGVRQVHNRLTVQTQNRSDEEMQPFEWGGERGWRGWEPEGDRGGFASRRYGTSSSGRSAYGQHAGVYGGYYDQPGRSGHPGGGASSSRGRQSGSSMGDEQTGAWLGEEPGRFGNRGPKGYQRSDDRIREDVCDRLTADADLDATDVTVIVKDGEVTLEGSVHDRTMKRRAEDCADEVPGVRQVHNRLAVQPQQQPRSAEPATSIGSASPQGDGG